MNAHNKHKTATENATYRCLASLRRQFLSHYFLSPPRWRVLIRQLNKRRALPDFCIIGPMKSGSSDLAVTIMSHPNVLPPLVKEFTSNNPLAWTPYYPTVQSVKRHAARHGVALCAFVAPRLHVLDIPVVLSALRPNTKIIINLRDPVDLVFSIWKWTVLHREKRLIDRVPFVASFPAYVAKAIELFPEIHDPVGNTLHQGIYATAVAHWLRSFGPENVRIFDIANYFQDRNAYFRVLENFLGLPHAPLPERLPVANANPLEGFAPDPDARAQLQQFFRPYNRTLWNVIGTTFPW